jgi:low density lipoprotein-related protein 2
VEFNSPGFSPGPTSPSLATDQIPPMDSYNLETLNNKSRDFSNPMYDAVQSDSHMCKSINLIKLIKNDYFIL